MTLGKFNREHNSRLNLRKRLFLGVAGAVVAISLAACGGNYPGSAAQVGSSSIAEAELTQEVELVVTALQLEPNAQVNRVILQRLVLEDLVKTLAREHDVKISEGEIQSAIDEATKTPALKAQFENALLNNGIPAESINDAVLMTLQLQALGDKLAPKGSEQEKQMAVSIAAVNLAGQEGVDVNPRFGVWDQTSLQIAPTPDTVSEPALVNDPGLNPVPMPETQ